jgi:hypothetical protein
MPLEIILKVAAQKKMKILFEVEAFWRVSSMRTLNNQLINTVIFE